VPKNQSFTLSAITCKTALSTVEAARLTNQLREKERKSCVRLLGKPNDASNSLRSAGAWLLPLWLSQESAILSRLWRKAMVVVWHVDTMSLLFSCTDMLF
jgi:hypothetical protein